MDASGRLRLDSVARYLQDAATDDVEETGWGAPEHLWVLRSIRIDALQPLLEDRTVDLATWGSGYSALAAGRRWSLVGDRGGSIEVDSVWIHLGPDARPARIEEFGTYAESAAGRVVSTRLELPEPPRNGRREPWPLRMSDIDLLGHMNNAAYWQAVEQTMLRAGPNPRRPLRAQLDYRHAIDLEDELELLESSENGRLAAAFMVDQVVKAVAAVEPLA
jgi:acyl-ACP thioesterase